MEGNSGPLITCESAVIHAQKIVDIMEKSKTIMENESEKMKRYYDKKRIEIKFNIGD